MDEPAAWMYQANADFRAAERFVGMESGWCHAVAKWQQTVEKTIKAVVCALHQADVINVGIRASHDVTQYVKTLVRLPRRAENRSIQHLLKGLLNQSTKAGIVALEALAPSMPTRRNTEYPFQDDSRRWTYPAADGVFTGAELQRFRDLAHRILENGGRIVSAVRRGTGS